MSECNGDRKTDIRKHSTATQEPNISPTYDLLVTGRAIHTESNTL